jgi:1-acyl-sn-glycerol-3-phosphate acyltransferase
VMEGRDIGTVVLPEAPVKIYLVADLDVRAARRADELRARGGTPDLQAIREAIAERDRRDLERTESPLRAAPGAITIDTTRMTIEEQVQAVVSAAERHLDSNRGGGGGRATGQEDEAALDDLRLDPEIRGFYRFVRTVARALFGLSFGWKIQGLEHLPAAGGFIVASNHVSWADPPLLGAAASRRLGYLAKVELFQPPGFRELIVALGAVPIRRQALDRRALDVTKKVLHAGLGLVLFPEGTRSRSGKLGPGKPGVSMLAAEAQVPVVPAYIHGTRDLASVLLRRSPLVIRFGAPLAPPPSGHGLEWREAMRAHTARIMEAIAELAQDAGAGRLEAA